MAACCLRQTQNAKRTWPVGWPEKEGEGEREKERERKRKIKREDMICEEDYRRTAEWTLASRVKLCDPLRKPTVDECILLLLLLLFCKASA